jgi:hypothetical protein
MSTDKIINENVSFSKAQKDLIESIIQNELSDLLINFEETLNRKIFFLEDKLKKSIEEFDNKLNEIKDKNNIFTEQVHSFKYLEEKLTSIEKKNK